MEKEKQMSEKYKILNLYACLGGNRYKWDDVLKQAGLDYEITAVELDPELARMYQERFPNDIVIVADAHQYLLYHYKEFNFIWTSPPCPTHSKFKLNQGKGTGNHKPVYPDMILYQEIIFLDNFYDGFYCVENVIPYYEPLIPAKKRGRHLYWTNFNIPNTLSTRKSISMDCKDEINKWCIFHDYDFWKYNGTQRRCKIARNLVDYEAGRTILETALNIQRENNQKQQLLFE